MRLWARDWQPRLEARKQPMSENLDDQSSSSKTTNDRISRDGLAAMAILVLTVVFIVVVLSQII